MKKVGLALGSGSAKGFAHIGVIQVLMENGVPVDMVCGCSMGAIIGSVFACGTDMYLLEKYVISADSKSYIDMTFPKHGGFVAGDRFQETVRLFTHDKQFNQTRIPFTCVATDLETGELVVFKEGRLHQAVRASMSIPGVFVPVRVGGRLCVDGGVLERVPCIPLREMGADIVIGVDVSSGVETSWSHNPSVVQVLNQCLNNMGSELSKNRTETAEIMLRPQVGFTGGISTAKAKECIEEGRRTALEALPVIENLLQKNGIALK